MATERGARMGGENILPDELLNCHGALARGYDEGNVFWFWLRVRFIEARLSAKTNKC